MVMYEGRTNLQARYVEDICQQWPSNGTAVAAANDDDDDGIRVLSRENKFE